MLECMHCGQIANFKTNSNIEIEKIPYALNSKLKKSIVIKEAVEVEDRFHSRYNAKQKTYRYILKVNMILLHLRQAEQVVKAV